MRWPQFCSSTVTSQAFALRSTLMNMYVQRISPGGKSLWALLPFPGLSDFSSAPEPTGRGLFGENGRAFSVIGTHAYQYRSDGLKTAIGAVAIDQYPASLITNGEGGNELAISSGGKMYVYNLSSGVFTEVLASGATMIDMMHGYILVFDIETSTFRNSNYLDALTVDPLTAFQRDAASDPWRAMIVNKSQEIILMVGERTTDALYDGGGGGLNPFVPVQGIKIPYGTNAPFSVKTLGSSTFWLTQNQDGARQVVEVQGYSERIISEAIEHQLSTLVRTDNAVGHTFQIQGHEWYILTFPTDSVSFGYDRTMRRWIDLGRWDSAYGIYRMWGPQFHTYEFGKNLVLDADTGVLSHLSTEVYTDGSHLMRRERIPPALFSENRSMVLDTLELLHEPGIGLRSGQGSDPQVIMQLSRDGGKTYGPQLSRSLGLQGKFDHRTRWNNLGKARSPVPKFIITDPVPFCITDLTVNVRPGAH